MPTTVLHLLPHRGGGAEKYIDLLEPLDGFVHRRMPISATRTPLVAPVSVAARWPRVARAARGADLLHVHGDMAALLAWPLPRRRPAVWTTHGLHLLRRAGGIRRAAVERGLDRISRHVAAVLCTSAEEMRELASFLSPPARGHLAVVANGVTMPQPPNPERRAATRAELGLGPTTCAVLFLGQLEERKDPVTAARAAQIARERGHDVVLLMAGSGPLAGALSELEGPAVRLLGFRGDATRLVEAADAFVLPSSREGLSFALLEAMSHGLPTVVADGAGNVEAVGKAGLVFPFGDSAVLAELIVRLAGDDAERRELGEAARARVASEYSADRLRAGVEQAYRAALSA